ncbi:TNF receptor-associated factor 6-like [Clytia hemisphaerica]|uniref:Uncharacterized protein n=1 Tax=Clytia hemisphaerica TaxID=252671 RepID=A0A7M5WXS1_9CNID
MASSPNEDTTTISTSSSRDRGGYDVEFFENEPDDVTCSICLMVLCEPMQAEECGHRFCRTCLEELRKSNNGILVCPEDRKIINVFRDRGKEREILNYVICCTNQEKGCNWTAPLRELQEHLEACQLLSIPCPRLMEGCQQSILRCTMDTHINEECLYRPVLCPFCTTQYLLAQESDHFQECLRYPVTCQHCSEENPREMFEKHVSEECTKISTPLSIREVWL